MAMFLRTSGAERVSLAPNWTTNGDVLWLVIRIVVIDVVKVRAYASGFAHATYASIYRQQRSLKRIGDMLPWHGIHPRRIDLPRPNGKLTCRGE
jgi:hypothetical protein